MTLFNIMYCFKKDTNRARSSITICFDFALQHQKMCFDDFQWWDYKHCICIPPLPIYLFIYSAGKGLFKTAIFDRYLKLCVVYCVLLFSCVSYYFPFPFHVFGKCNSFDAHLSLLYLLLRIFVYSGHSQ